MSVFQIEIDGEIESCEPNHTTFDTPRLHYNIHPDAKALGPQGFSLVIAEPSERVLAMQNGTEHIVRIFGEPGQMTVPVRRTASWTDEDGIKKVLFIYRPDSALKWEPLA